MNLFRLNLILILLVINQSIFAHSNDTIVLSGKVVENRIPFPKAKIKLKGTEIETETDFDGNFTLKVPPNIKLKEIIIIASYVGMIPKEVKIRNVKRRIKIRLKPEMIIIE